MSARCSSSCCYPVLSFLHVPGKMSKPLWLMMGTAFCIRCGHDHDASASPQRTLLLSAKHVFMPWDYTKDAAELKIPQDYRKPRYVVGRLYLPDAHTGRADPAASVALRLVALHPTLDVALLAVHTGATLSSTAARHDEGTALRVIGPAVRLYESSPLPRGTRGDIVGYRGVGRLGELDTLDASLLRTLPVAERDALLRELHNVEGKQEAVSTSVEVLEGHGMCRGVVEDDAATTVGARHGCYQGMSGAPLLLQHGAETLCGGVLYGRHHDFPQYIGYTPCDAFAPWLHSLHALT